MIYDYVVILALNENGALNLSLAAGPLASAVGAAAVELVKLVVRAGEGPGRRRPSPAPSVGASTAPLLLPPAPNLSQPIAICPIPALRSLVPETPQWPHRPCAPLIPVAALQPMRHRTASVQADASASIAADTRTRRLMLFAS